MFSKSMKYLLLDSSNASPIFSLGIDEEQLDTDGIAKGDW
jgi:hypothetical protein